MGSSLSGPGYGGTREQWYAYQFAARKRAAKARGRMRSADQPLAIWTEDETLRPWKEERVRAAVAVLNTPGCTWARGTGCLMCGYTNDVRTEAVSVTQLEKQLERISGRAQGAAVVKLFDSGSILDPLEMGEDAWKAMGPLARLAREGTLQRVVIESRPDHVTVAALENFRDAVAPARLQLAMGLESASDTVLKGCINKGFTVDELRHAAVIAKRTEVEVKAYLLLKPPFVSEWGALGDCDRSIRLLLDEQLADTISINPINVQSFTVVEALHRSGAYRTPWLWSVVDLLRKWAPLAGEQGVRLMSSPTGGGKSRGAHNCGECDASMLEAIEEFSLSGTPEVLGGLECPCRKEYDMLVELRDRTFG